MDKKIILLPLLFIFQIVSAQEVNFSERAYDNGLTYPVAQFTGNADAEKSLNENILKIISTYEDQDFCIGEYGYVQRTSFIQLNFYFNCIDMDESKSESHLFSLSDGEVCPPSEMFLEGKEKLFRTFFGKKVSAHYIQNGKEAPSSEVMNELTIDDCETLLLEEGIQISIASKEDWPEDDLLIKWSELRPYLKTIFI
ncbi:MAG: hypothetical protein AB8B56_15510 [Crocinitomicaceae bacterium]